MSKAEESHNQAKEGGQKAKTGRTDPTTTYRLTVNCCEEVDKGKGGMKE